MLGCIIRSAINRGGRLFQTESLPVPVGLLQSKARSGLFRLLSQLLNEICSKRLNPIDCKCRGDRDAGESDTRHRGRETRRGGYLPKIARTGRKSAHTLPFAKQDANPCRPNLIRPARFGGTGSSQPAGYRRATRSDRRGGGHFGEPTRSSITLPAFSLLLWEKSRRTCGMI